jgi:hypothetical protein
MTIIFNNTVMTTKDTPEQAVQLCTTMKYARDKWVKEGRPNSGDH